MDHIFVLNNAKILTEKPRCSKCDVREATGIDLRPRNLNSGTGRAGFPLLGSPVGNQALLPTPHPLKPWVRPLLFPFSIQVSFISEDIYGSPEKGRTCSSFTPFSSLPESSSGYRGDVLSHFSVSIKQCAAFKGSVFFF
jgi:hypothetical protein